MGNRGSREAAAASELGPLGGGAGRAQGPGASLALACVLPGCRLGELLKTVSGIRGRA